MVRQNQCYEWHGSRNENGYGRAYKEGRGQYVHRLVWEALHGPIPADLVVMHTCDNPACYRVDHLRLGTQADNMRDMREKGKESYPARRTHCPRGHEYTSENTDYNKTGAQVCITCRNRKKSCPACGKKIHMNNLARHIRTQHNK